MSKQNKKWYSFVPNLFTSSNLICGTVGTYLALNGKIQAALILMVTAALFDFFDGFIARALKVSGELGKQLDSLADVISFGILPGSMLFWLQSRFIPEFSVSSDLNTLQFIFIISPVLIPLFSALRLAKFNIDERQHSEFYGLPTPANALFLASLSWTLTYRQDSFFSFLNNQWILTAIIIIFSLLLVSEIRLFALKFSDFSLKNNSIRYIFLFCSALLLIGLGIIGIAGVIILYIILSVLYFSLSGKKI